MRTRHGAPVAIVFVAFTLCACGSSGAHAPPLADDDSGAALDATDAFDAQTSDVAETLDGTSEADAPFTPTAHRPWPQLDANAKRVLASPKLVTLVAANDDTPDPLASFSDALVKSAWWKTVAAEYGVGAFTDDVHVVGPAMPATMTTSDVATWVQSSGAPAADGSTIYLVYLPSTTAISGANFLSFHAPFPDRTTSIGDALAIVSRESPATGETQLDQLTKVASHEVIEAATNPTGAGYRLAHASTTTPWTSSAWASTQTGAIENGDLCEGTRVREPDDASGWLYQRVFSNAAAALGGDPCVPARSDAYFDVSIANDWYTGAAGATVSIPIVGWSTAARADWLMNARDENATTSLRGMKLGAGFTFDTTLGVGTHAGCFAREGMNDGVTGTFDVTIPAGAKSGDWAVFVVRSFDEDPTTCTEPATEDLFHAWAVGVYVP